MNHFRALMIRQKEEALPTAKALATKGVESYVCPLFKLSFLSFPLLANPQGLIITSKNAVRALKERDKLKNLPLYAVGDQTAHLARTLGFSTVFSAAGTSQELLSLILQKASPSKGILWHLSGDVVKGNLVETLKENGFQAERRIIYCMQEVHELPFSLIDHLQYHRITHVLFFSPRTTDIFVDLLKKSKLEAIAPSITSLCLSQNVVEKAHRLEWEKIWVSPRPTVKDMIGYFNGEQ